jgi:hypothetical protein
MQAAVLAVGDPAMERERELLELGGPAWRLASRVLGTSEGAEDVV